MWAKFPAQLLHRQSYLLLLLHSGAGTYGEQHPRLWPTTKSHKLAVAAQWCQGGRSLLVFSCCQRCSNHAWAACSLVPQPAQSCMWSAAEARSTGAQGTFRWLRSAESTCF